MFLNHLFAFFDQLLSTVPKKSLLSTTAVVGALLAFGAAGFSPMTPDTSEIVVETISEILPLPDLSTQRAQAFAQPALNTYVSQEKMRSGDTISSLLRKLGVNDRGAEKFITSDSTARALLRLKAGTVVSARTDGEGQLQSLRTTFVNTKEKDALPHHLVIHRTQHLDTAINDFGVSFEPAQLEKHIEMHSGVIQSSLFAATDAAGLPDAIALQVVDLFSTQINFASDLKRGDRFHLVYETFWQEGQFIKNGRILAAEFVNREKTYRSVLFDDAYYDFEGKSLKKAFLKSPIAFTRISSGFSGRKHPISGKWKQHNGVDFAAPSGTPVRATSDGVVSFIGAQGGYGNVVFLKHPGGITTVYAHMSRFARFKKGDKVDQGDVIGYVGMTGWATGPHLHYEFRIANRPQDPMSVKIPTVQALNATQMKAFRKVSAEMGYRFSLLATNDTGPAEAGVS